MSATEAKHTAHTPGPWTLQRTSCDIGCCDDLYNVLAQYPEDERPMRELARVDGGNAVWLREGEALANARLIASAPQLAADNARLSQQVAQLRAALKTFCPDDDTPCACEDWMIVAPGDKCNYCNARDALAASEPQGDATL